MPKASKLIALATLLLSAVLTGCALAPQSNRGTGHSQATNAPTPPPSNEVSAAVAQAIKDWLTQNPNAAWIKAEKSYPILRTIHDPLNDHAPPIKLVIGEYYTLTLQTRAIGLNLGGLLAKDGQGSPHVLIVFATYDKARRPIVLLLDDVYAYANYVMFGFESPPLPEDSISEHLGSCGKYNGAEVLRVFRCLNAYNSTTPNTPTFGRLDTVISSQAGVVIGVSLPSLMTGATTVGRITSMHDVSALDLSSLVSNQDRGTMIVNIQSSVSKPPTLQ